MDEQPKLNEVKKKETIKEKENQKCKHDIFDFACIIAEYNKVKIPSKVLKEIQIKPFRHTRISNTV